MFFGRESGVGMKKLPPVWLAKGFERERRELLGHAAAVSSWQVKYRAPHLFLSQRLDPVNERVKTAGDALARRYTGVS